MAMDNAPAAVDPSMEDILASIRRILNEEEVKPPEREPQPALPAAPEPDILVLDHSMMVSTAPAGHPPAEPPAVPVPPVAMASEPMSHTASPTANTATLIAPEAAAAAAGSVGALLQTLAKERSTAVARGGPTIEDLVREEVRPMLKEWLDTHLPPVVERLVRAEIERVVNRTA